MPLKVGLVGLKGIGQTHAQSYATDPLAQLVAVCDVIESRADEVAAKHNAVSYTHLCFRRHPRQT